MPTDPWNHNIHYHSIALNAVPQHSRRALDVGCGQGLLVQKLAQRCQEVTGIDLDGPTLAHARSACSGLNARAAIHFIEGDILTYPFPEASFDLITSIATLHHLPLTRALARFRDLLRPGGTLAIVGLYRTHTLVDYAWAAIALPASRLLRRAHRFVETAAPLRDPQETLSEIKAASRAILPGSVLQRRLLFRYSLLWQKP
jgi:SAM-dependent methyltransferase